MNLTFFILFDFLSSITLSPSFPSFTHFLSLALSLTISEFKWNQMICMHLQNIACALFAVKGMEKRVVVVVVLVGVCVLRHWHQTILWYGNGRAREEWLLTEALFGCRPRSIPPSISIPQFFSHLLSFITYVLSFLSFSIVQPIYLHFFTFILSIFCLTLLSRPTVSLTHDLTIGRQVIFVSLVDKPTSY